MKRRKYASGRVCVCCLAVCTDREFGLADVCANSYLRARGCVPGGIREYALLIRNPHAMH